MKLHTESERAQFRQVRAEEMLRWPTPAERKLAADLLPLGFKAQVDISLEGGHHGYILDFYHAAGQLCVEVDGGYHKKRKGPDRRRDNRLRMAGVITVRCTNAEVLDKRKYPAVLERIKAALL